MELMLRRLFADSGTPEELAASLHALREWADRLREIGARQCVGYLATGGPFPGRLDLIALFGEFFGQLYAMTGGWAQRAEADVARSPATTRPRLGPHARERLQAVVSHPCSRGLPDTGNQGTAPSGAAPDDYGVPTGWLQE